MKGRSLRKQVEATRRDLANETGPRRRATVFARLAVELIRTNDWLIWIIALAIGIGGLWIPRLFAVQWPDPSIVSTFLPVAWQVQGAALGLSLAVVVFSFQAFGQSRFAGSLREFAGYSLATPIVVFGLVSLLVDGLALLGIGRGAPNGWAGTWAIILSLVSIALLPLLLLLLLRGLEARSLHIWRIRRLRQLMRLEVADDLRGRLAFSQLAEACEDAGWEFLPLFGAGPRQGGWQEIRPDATGFVIDVRLEVLKEVVALCPPDSKPVLLARLGQQVSEEHPVVLLPPSADAAALSVVQSLLRIGHRKDHQQAALESAIQILHQQALQAFRDRNAVWYEEITDAYEEVLIALPEAWADYGVKTFHRGLAQPFDLVSRAPIELVIRQLYRELRSAFRSSEPEIVEHAVSLPYTTLLRSRRVRAEALSKAMLDLLVYAYELAVATPDEALAQVGVDRVSQFVVEFAQRTLYEAHQGK